MILSLRHSLCLLTGLVLYTSCQTPSVKKEQSTLAIADTLLTTILDTYTVEKYGLLSETYPINPNNQVSYLAEGAEQQKNQEVAFLWPYSGMLSGLIALYEYTDDSKYLGLIEGTILPGLDMYWDPIREPYCYQSYPLFNGESDRFYDDNDWLAIDFCDLYRLTGREEYLDRAIQLHAYIYSGWDNLLDGGIYWCEQQKVSKNTCSNAPAAVLCMKLYQLTGEMKYLEQAKETYEWTKQRLMDPADGVYWDNVRLDGSVDTRKYTYNSGQMIQAGVLLYQTTGDESYLQDAKKSAAGSYNHFTSVQQNKQGEEMLFYSSMPWFNVILLRGLVALYEVDGNDTYIRTMKDNALYAWQYTRDENGLLGNSWTGKENKKYKWLLDNACMLELYSQMNQF